MYMLYSIYNIQNTYIYILTYIFSFIVTCKAVKIADREQRNRVNFLQ